MKPGPVRRPATAVLGDVLALVLALGWEGPWIFWLGLHHGVTVEWMAGLVITVMLWRHVFAVVYAMWTAPLVPDPRPAVR